MATINLGAIKFNWKGAYNSGTSYAVDDVVSSGGNSYVCIQAHSNQAVGNATAYWNIMSSAGTNGTNGTNGTDVGTVITTQGDILYRDGSGLQRLPKGTANQVLKMNSGATAPEYGTITSGTYSVHKIDYYSYASEISHSSTANYIDIAGGYTVNFTPTSTNDYVFFTHYNAVNWGNHAEGCDVYLNMGTSSSLSESTKLNYNGQHATYYNQLADVYTQISKQIMLPCTSLNVGTTYYVEQAGANHNGNTIAFNKQASSGSASPVTGSNRHHVTMTHYKKN